MTTKHRSFLAGVVACLIACAGCGNESSAGGALQTGAGTAPSAFGTSPASQLPQTPSADSTLGSTAVTPSVVRTSAAPHDPPNDMANDANTDPGSESTTANGSANSPGLTSTADERNADHDAGGSTGQGETPTSGGTGGRGPSAEAPALQGAAGSDDERGTPNDDGMAPRRTDERSISFGTLLNPQSVVQTAQQLALAQGDPSSPQWRAKGDQRRRYASAETGAEEPYRIVVPTSWDGSSELPLLMFLHGAGSDENTYLDQNGGQLVQLAERFGYLLVSPRGASGAYGNFLRLSAPFGNPTGADELMSMVTSQSELGNEQSEQDVINVLELVLHEYPIDRSAMFLAGHSMGSGGTWYIGGKYAHYWRGLAPMSGPFVQEKQYPWEDLRDKAIVVTEGTQTPSLEGSQLLGEWLSQNGFMAEYWEVDADHGGMIALVLPDIFDFFERAR